MKPKKGAVPFVRKPRAAAPRKATERTVSPGPVVYVQCPKCVGAGMLFIVKAGEADVQIVCNACQGRGTVEASDPAVPSLAQEGLIRRTIRNAVEQRPLMRSDVNPREVCPPCKGRGYIDRQVNAPGVQSGVQLGVVRNPCGACGATGTVPVDPTAVPLPAPTGRPPSATEARQVLSSTFDGIAACKLCGGKGHIGPQVCRACRGTGTITRPAGGPPYEEITATSKEILQERDRIRSKQKREGLM